MTNYKRIKKCSKLEMMTLIEALRDFDDFPKDWRGERILEWLNEKEPKKKGK